MSSFSLAPTGPPCTTSELLERDHVLFD